jgi:parvulin-like peptidyl-prolyl isomerase
MMVNRPTFFRTLVLAASLAALTGCGKKQVSEDSVVARIGDRTITAEYYKQMLGKMKPETLPRGENGEPVDTATLEGKQAFLDVLVNKELMVSKALQEGYDKDTQVQQGLEHLKEYHGMIYFWEDVIGEPAKTVSEEELQHYYSRLGEKRSCDYIITDFESDAIKARDAARAGTPWPEIVAKYNAASSDPNRPNTIDVPWGKFTDEFERAVFAVKEGEITDPIPTQYGFWVMRVNKITQEKKPELDAIRVRVLDSIRKRKINLAQEDLKTELRKKHNFAINEDALLVVFNGLPAEEHIIDPKTGKPTPREDLLPLNVPSEHLDEVLFSYNLSTGPIVFSVGDYKARFDEMNVFDRAKKQELLGTLRTKIEDEAEKAILLDEARTRGFLEDPRTIKAANRQIEEMLVERVHEDQIAADTYVSPEQLNAFWQEHSAEYAVPEVREGMAVICKDRATAEQAREAAINRADEPNIWKQVNKLYGSVPKLEREFGRLHKVRADAKDVPCKDLLFSLPLNEVSQPTQIPDGWAVVKCTEITAASQPELKDVSESVGQRIRAIRKDEALSKMLAQWRQEFKVTVDNKVLAAMPSLADLAAPAEDLKPVVEKTLDGNT